ncbi:glycosyltransferase family 2 protein [Sulfurirhabdus autotrophica]|uniref:Glycosyltransferase involved in cell wall biosynthesis n=1 Tax=Sulfurirhabdus autotrophica TaxID=1706046 RepID=A0A4R3XY78_9PROT|nr:glycosyltransferase family 2 protein [Sulfurirhabdus autotrophica]TCV84276.1 glycosyltransferase involved in cell wall biosynthesis [Sulfurirhabdus autotrophica]
MHRISLIIPCYRDSATLGRAIESAYAQTMPAYEIIVINDCSPETEEIEKVLKAYKDVVYFKNPVNIGLAATRNKGVSIAGGEIVTFLDADDELHPQKLELQYPFVGKNCVVACNVERVAIGRLPGQWCHYEQANAKLFRGSRWMIYRNALTGASLMVYKCLLERMGGYDSDLRSCEDFDLWLRFAKEGIQINNIRLPLYRYYFNQSGLSKNYLNISNWEVKVLLKHFSRECVTLSNSKWAASVWAFYLLKQMARYEASNDPQLAELIDSNLSKLDSVSYLFTLLRLIWISRLPKAYVKLFGGL